MSTISGPQRINYENVSFSDKEVTKMNIIISTGSISFVPKSIGFDGKIELGDELHTLEKETIDEFCRLNQNHDELMHALQEVEKEYDIVRAANLRYDSIQEINTAITKLKSGSNENSMLMETIREPKIAIPLARQLSDDNKMIFRKDGIVGCIIFSVVPNLFKS